MTDLNMLLLCSGTTMSATQTLSLSLSQISFHFPFPKQSLQSGVVSHKNCLIAVAVTEVEVARFRFLRIAIPVPWGILEELEPELE